MAITLYGIPMSRVAAVVGWAPTLGRMTLDGTPAVAAWLERCTARPAWARATARR